MSAPERPFPEPGALLQMVRAGSTVRVESRVAEGGQGVVYLGRTDQGAQLAVKWYRPSRFIDRQRRAIADLASHNRPHASFAWPIDLVECPGIAGFGYVMPWVPERFNSLIELLRAPEQPSFRVIIDLARELVDAFAALHASGLCYRDVNFGNLLVDPQRRDVAIVDNDNVGVEGGDVFVKGTLRFMAPEIIRDEALPSTTSDLHSLAVFLFFMLVHGHPLEGRRVRVSYTWDEDGHISETKLAVRHFGEDPLFVFDPNDSSNCPEPGDPMLMWWPIYPRFLHQLFLRAFGTGLTDATLSGRVTEGEWRKALVRLGDCISACSCTAAVFWDPDDPEHRCWNCAAIPPAPALLRVPGRVVVLTEGATLAGDLLGIDTQPRVPQAIVERHPTSPGELVLRNVSDIQWTVQPEGEAAKAVRPRQRLGIRAMAIDFGKVQGTIAPGALAHTA